LYFYTLLRMINHEISNEELTAKLIHANIENALELEAINKKVSTQNDKNEKQVAELIVKNEENALALIIANKKLVARDDESDKRAEELINAYRELKETDRKLALLRADKEKRAAELIVANTELVYQNKEKEKRSKELTKSKELLDETGKLGKLGGWEIDITNNKMSWSDVVYQIHEVSPDFQPGIESSINFYVPEFKPVITEAVYQTMKDGTPFDLELQLITSKLNKIWVRVIGHAYSINGEIVKIGGMFQDITERKLAEESLVKMKKAINTSGEAIFLTDSNGVFTYINPAFTSLYGFTSEEIINKRSPRIFKSGELNETAYEDFWDTLLNGDEVRGELINKKKDGSLINIEGSSTPILDDENKIIGFLGIQRDITERKNAEKELNKSKQQLRNFAAHLQNVREEEKKAVAREIHDDLGQMLVALKIDLGLFRQQIAKGYETIRTEEMMSKFDQLSGLLDKTIITTRRIMTGLRPEIIDSLGFIEAGKSYLLEFEERYHLPCLFESSVSELNLHSQQSVALYRILQETLNNVVKHAHATEIKIQLSCQLNKFIMEIRDNGIGYDKNQEVRSDSYGMIGMKERVMLLDGELIISGNKGKGTCVRVEMPYVNESNYKRAKTIE